MSKRFMAKVVSVVIAGCMMFSVAACAKKTDNAKASTSGTSASAPVTTAAAAKVDYSKMEPMKLSMMGIAWGSAAAPDSDYEKQFEKKLNANLDITWVPYQEYTNRFNLLLASGDTKDVMQVMAVNGSIFYPQVVQAIKGGVFQDLDSILKNTDYIKQNKFMKSWDEQVWKYCSYNNKIYFLPRTTTPIASNSGLIVRKDLMDKAGLKEPTTLDEFADFIIKLNKPGEYYGLQFSKTDFDATEVKPIAVAYTGVQDWGVDKDGNFFFQSFMPEYKDFLNWIKKLYDAKAIDPEFALAQYANSDFVKGKAAVKMHTWWNWDQSEDGKTKKFFDKTVSDDAKVWGLMPIKGPKAYTTGIGMGFETPVLISSKVAKKDLDRVFSIINNTDDDFQWLMSYGMEGRHYDMVNGKPVAQTDDQKKKKTEEYVGGWYQLFQKKDSDYVQEKYVDYGASAKNVERVKAIRDASDKYAKEANLTMPQLTLESNSFNSKWNTVTKDLKDNRVKYVMGKMTSAEWDTYINGIKSSADYQAILKEFKEGYLATKK